MKAIKVFGKTGGGGVGGLLEKAITEDLGFSCVGLALGFAGLFF